MVYKQGIQKVVHNYLVHGNVKVLTFIQLAVLLLLRQSIEQLETVTKQFHV